MTLKLCVAIPVFDNAGTIADVVARARRECEAVLVVDDGSRDGSGTRAAEAGAVVLRHEKNLGKGEALKTAFVWAREQRFTHVATLDGDGQHFPEDLPELMAAAEEDPRALVLGERAFAELPEKNRFGNRFSNRWVNWAAGTRLADTQCGFRIYPADTAERFLLRGHGYAFETEAVVRHARARSPIAVMPVRVAYPKVRVSHFRPRRDATRIVFTVMRFLFLPRWFWCALFFVGCTSHGPPPRAALPLLEARALAERSLSAPFVAEQHVVFDDGKERRDASGLFFVAPGVAYRLRVLGPLGITAFDVEVRCGRYRIEIPSQHKILEGSLAHPEVTFFPVAELWQTLVPLTGGEWHGQEWRGGERRAALDLTRGGITRIDIGESMRVDVRGFADVGDLRLPSSLSVTLPGGRHLQIDNRQLSTDAPPIDKMVGEVDCAP
jgi:hypothetical protein